MKTCHNCGAKDHLISMYNEQEEWTTIKYEFPHMCAPGHGCNSSYKHTWGDYKLTVTGLDLPITILGIIMIIVTQVVISPSLGEKIAQGLISMRDARWGLFLLTEISSVGIPVVLLTIGAPIYISPIVLTIISAIVCFVF